MSKDQREFTATVTITAPDQQTAEQVITERINHDEAYEDERTGEVFEYTINAGPVQPATTYRVGQSLVTSTDTENTYPGVFHHDSAPIDNIIVGATRSGMTAGLPDTTPAKDDVVMGMPRSGMTAGLPDSTSDVVAR